MQNDKLKVHLITQEEPFFIPKFVGLLLENQKDFSIETYTVLSPSRKDDTIFEWFLERFRVYSLSELFLTGGLFLLCKVNNLLRGSKSPYYVKGVLENSDTEELNTEDINSSEYISKLKSFNPDIIFSISCPQLFGKELLNLPNKYCLNAHGTLLPRHRGVFGSWWTLFSGDEVGGGTIHTMEPKLDAGKIMWQESYPIEDSDTQYSVAYKSKCLMANGFVQLMQEISDGREKVVQNQYDSSYHEAPSKVESKKFRKKGNRIIKLKDIELVLRNSF